MWLSICISTFFILPLNLICIEQYQQQGNADKPSNIIPIPPPSTVSSNGNKSPISSTKGNESSYTVGVSSSSNTNNFTPPHVVINTPHPNQTTGGSEDRLPSATVHCTDQRQLYTERCLRSWVKYWDERVSRGISLRTAG